MRPQSIGDIVEYGYACLYFVLGISNDKCTVVKKPGKHLDYIEYLNDDNTTDWDKAYTERNVPIEKLKLVKSFLEQQEHKKKSN